MKGRQILIEPLPAGGHAAALMVDGRLEDLLVDPDPADPAPRPEAIYRAVPARPMKGLGGVIVDLGGGLSGFLRGPSPPAPGRPLLVQVERLGGAGQGAAGHRAAAPEGALRDPHPGRAGDQRGALAARPGAARRAGGARRGGDGGRGAPASG